MYGNGDYLIFQELAKLGLKRREKDLNGQFLSEELCDEVDEAGETIRRPGRNTPP